MPTDSSEPKRAPAGVSFDPGREPVTPTAAATVIVVREALATGSDASAPRSIEVFCVRRHAKSGFMGGAIVFPGGKVDADDAHDDWAAMTGAVDPRALGFAGDLVEARALAVAACRELVEEAGILPVSAAGDVAVDVSPDAIATLRGRLGTRSKAGEPLRKIVTELGLRLDVDALVPFARWVTPTAESRRFDARFYLLALPEGQEGRHDEEETTASFWASPAEVLAMFERGEVGLFPPTTRTLELLAGVSSLDEARAFAAKQSLLPVCPLFVAGEPPFLALPGDPSHELGERRVDGPTRFVLREGRFVSEDP